MSDGIGYDFDNKEIETIFEQASSGGFDVMQEETEREILRIKKRLAAEYQQAFKELKKKWEAYYGGENSAVNIEYKEKLKALNEGKITQTEYDTWRQKVFFENKNLKAQVKQMSQYLANVDQQAADIANGKRYKVYADNYNYARYEVEKGLKIDTSFTMFDQKTVEKLAKDNPKLLPKVNPDKIKGQKWSKRKINNVITQGILQGKPLPEIAKGFRTVVGMDWNSAVRNARTALTGAQNSGRLNSYKDATRIGISLKKEWVATLDERTRTSHGALDGKKVEIDKPFENGLMFPADPEGPPAEVYNCRCTMIADLLDYPRENFQRYDNIAGVPIENVSYSQWAQAKKPSTSGDTFGEKILQIKNDPTLSEAEKIRKAGKVMANELNGEYLDDLAKEQEWVETEGKELRKIKKHAFPTDELMQRSDDWEERRDAFKQLNDYKNHSNLLVKKLSEVRQMGYANDYELKMHLNNSKSPARKYVEWAYKRYPTDWVDDSVNYDYLIPKKVDRGYYSHFMNEIGIDVWGNEMQPRSTAIHELGHRFEYVRSGIRDAEKQFYEYRTKGETLQWLGGSYAKSEKTRKDKFVDPYMGKDYGGRSYELVSMGFELVYTNPLALRKDKEMLEWIYGILCIL